MIDLVLALCLIGISALFAFASHIDPATGRFSPVTFWCVIHAASVDLDKIWMTRCVREPSFECVVLGFTDQRRYENKPIRSCANSARPRQSLRKPGIGRGLSYLEEEGCADGPAVASEVFVDLQDDSASLGTIEATLADVVVVPR